MIAGTHVGDDLPPALDVFKDYDKAAVGITDFSC